MKAVRWVDENGQEVKENDERLPEWWSAVWRKCLTSKAEFPAVLASLLVLAAGEIPPNIKIGGSPPDSLNLFMAVFGPPGSGKTTGFRLAKELLPPPEGTYKMTADDGSSFAVTPPSGAGLLGTWICREAVKTGKPGQPPKKLMRGKHFSTLIRIDEGARWEYLEKREGNDVMPLVRSAFSGEGLDTASATEQRKRFIAEDSYRLGFLFFVQPEIAIPSIKDKASGTQQRFLALSCWDEATGRAQAEHEAGVALPPPPTGNIFPEQEGPNGERQEDPQWRPPSWEGVDIDVIPVAAAVAEEADRLRRGQAAKLKMEAGGAGIPPELKEDMDALVADTALSPSFLRIDHGEHTVRIRSRLAAALAYLRMNRSLRRLLTEGVSEEDWWLAYLIMAASAAAWENHNEITKKMRADARKKQRTAEALAGMDREQGRRASRSKQREEWMERPLRRAAEITDGGNAGWGVFWEGLGGWRKQAKTELEMNSEELKEAVEAALEGNGFQVVENPDGKGRIIVRETSGEG